MAHHVDVLISKLEAIGHLTPEHKAVLRELPIRVAQLERGDDAASDAEVVSSSCLVLDGLMHRYKFLPDGSRQILSFHPIGDIPDLQSLHLKKMDHGLAATTPCTVGLIAHTDIKVALRRAPGLSDLLWRESLIDAARFRIWMTMIGQSSADARMAHLFCEMYVRIRMTGLIDSTTFDFQVTQTELADALGISAVHANRTLQDLRASGLLAFDRGVAQILDWDGLRQVAQFDAAYLHYLDREPATRLFWLKRDIWS